MNLTKKRKSEILLRFVVGYSIKDLRYFWFHKYKLRYQLAWIDIEPKIEKLLRTALTKGVKIKRDKKGDILKVEMR